MPELGNDHRTLFRCSLFLHVGYIGAVTVAAGLAQLLAGEASWLSGLGLVLFGGTLATTSWRRARTIVELPDRAPVATALVRRADRPGTFERSPSVPPAADVQLHRLGSRPRLRAQA